MRDFPRQGAFFRDLQRVFINDYNLPQVVGLHDIIKRPRWWQRVAFTDPDNNRRWVFNVGDYAVIHQDQSGTLIHRPVLLLQMFTVGFRRQIFPFIIAAPVSHLMQDNGDTPVLDDVLQMPITTWQPDDTIIFGIPSIAFEHIYLLPAPRNVGGAWESQSQFTSSTDENDSDDDGDDERVDEGRWLILCKWNLEWM